MVLRVFVVTFYLTTLVPRRSFVLFPLWIFRTPLPWSLLHHLSKTSVASFVARIFKRVLWCPSYHRGNWVFLRMLLFVMSAMPWVSSLYPRNDYQGCHLFWSFFWTSLVPFSGCKLLVPLDCVWFGNLLQSYLLIFLSCRQCDFFSSCLLSFCTMVLGYAAWAPLLFPLCQRSKQFGVLCCSSQPASSCNFIDHFEGDLFLCFTSSLFVVSPFFCLTYPSS